MSAHKTTSPKNNGSLPPGSSSIPKKSTATQRIEAAGDWCGKKKLGSRYVLNHPIEKSHQRVSSSSASLKLDKSNDIIPKIPKSSVSKLVTSDNNSGRSAPQSSSSSPANSLSSGPRRNFVSPRASEAAEYSAVHSVPVKQPNQQHRRPPLTGQNHLSLQSLRSLIGKPIQYNRPSASSVNNTTPNDTKSPSDRVSPKSKTPSVPQRPQPKTSASDVSKLPKSRRVAGVPQPSLNRTGLRPQLKQPFGNNSSRGPCPAPRSSAFQSNLIQGNRGLVMAAQRLNQSGNQNNNYDPYGLDECEEDLDFIDDGPLDDEYSSNNSYWKTALRGITGYNPAMYEDEGEAAESSLTQLEFEEIRSGKIAKAEDASELEKIQMEEERQMRLKAAKVKKKV